MEHENEFANKGVAGAGLGLGIAGTALGLLNNGGLGNILGNMGGCSEDHYVNRFEAEQAAKIASLETQVNLRDANTFALGEVNKLRDYMEKRFDCVEHQLCDQKVYNATNTAAISDIQRQVVQLMSLTKLVVPNTSVCPGWGEVNVSIPTTTTGA